MARSVRDLRGDVMRLDRGVSEAATSASPALPQRPPCASLPAHLDRGVPHPGGAVPRAVAGAEHPAFARDGAVPVPVASREVHHVTYPHHPARACSHTSRSARRGRSRTAPPRRSSPQRPPRPERPVGGQRHDLVAVELHLPHPREPGHPPRGEVLMPRQPLGRRQPEVTPATSSPAVEVPHVVDHTLPVVAEGHIDHRGGGPLNDGRRTELQALKPRVDVGRPGAHALERTCVSDRAGGFIDPFNAAHTRPPCLNPSIPHASGIMAVHPH
jgi:hypothetical protein